MGQDGGHGALARVASAEPLGQKPAWSWGRGGGSEEGEIVQPSLLWSVAVKENRDR